MPSPAPVGLFDSGVGGLSVLREIRAALPSESVYYVADSAHAPWGDKPPSFVRERGLKIAHFLVAEGVKAIVIGSNTGTAGSAEALRSDLDVPVVGIEPGIKPAVNATRSRVVGAIVPAAVGGSDRLASLLDRFSGDVEVIVQPVPGVVEHIEAAGDVFRRVDGLAGVVENVGSEHPRDRRLFDHLAIVAAVQSGQNVADGACLLDQRLQIPAGAMLARKQPQYRVFQSAGDQVVL